MSVSITKNGITMQGSGSGDSAVIVSADVNEGIDYNESFRIGVNASLYRDVVVTRQGKREIFTDNDFLLVDGSTFNVLKNGIQQ